MAFTTQYLKLNSQLSSLQQPCSVGKLGMLVLGWKLGNRRLGFIAA